MAALNVSKHGEELSRHLNSYVLPVTVLISVEAFVGFFGNIAILIVYSKQYRHVNFRYFVLALAFVDLISCCTTLPGEVFSQMNWYDYKYTWICKVKSFFNVFTAWGSASVLLTLAIDRYRKVCQPCHWQIRFHVAFRLCICCLLISAIVSIPILLLWGTQSYLYEFKGKTFSVSVCEKSGDYSDTIYPLLYISGVYLVPVSVMIVVSMTLNFIIAWRLFGNHSVKYPSVRHYAMKGVYSGKVRPGLCEETKTIYNNIGTDDNRSEKPIENPNGSVRGPIIKLPTVPKENLQDNISPIQELSTDNFSTDEDLTSDFEESRSVSTDKIPSEKKNRISRRSRRSNYRQMSTFQRKNKTMIMLILTSIFAATMATYIILTSLVAEPGGILKEMSDTNKSIFFFFWRLYFVNSVVNPILYGFMDPGFRSGFMHYVQKSKTSVTSCS